MGIHNFSLQMNQALRESCLFCGGKIIEVTAENKDMDSFDYICPSCNPMTVISLSGSVVVHDDFDKDHIYFRATKTRIQQSKKQITHVIESDLFD